MLEPVFVVLSGDWVEPLTYCYQSSISSLHRVSVAASSRPLLLASPLPVPAGSAALSRLEQTTGAISSTTQGVYSDQNLLPWSKHLPYLETPTY